MAATGAANPVTDFRAAFSSSGVAWVAGGKACVARAPDFSPSCPRLPRVVAVAWNGSDAWAALPDVGQIITLDRAAQSRSVGAVVALSAQTIYREDGSVLNYAGSLVGQLTGTPSRVLTGGDGNDYALTGTVLRRVSDGAVIENPAQHELYAVPAGVQTAPLPTLVTDGAVYQLRDGTLERRDITGKVLARVADDGAALGSIGQDIVTVDTQGHIRRYSGDLQVVGSE